MSESVDHPGLTPPSRDRMRAAGYALIALVDDHIPLTVGYPREPRWHAYTAAMVVRMADTVRSLLAVMESGGEGDAMILLRLLYEQVVIFAWIAIEPEPHLGRWIENAFCQRRRLHHDALEFGLELVPAEELEAHADAKPLAAIKDLAAEIDDHWGRKLDGFRTRQFDGSPNDILTFRGIYMSVYRMASRVAHAQPESLDAYPTSRPSPSASRSQGPAMAPSSRWRYRSTPKRSSSATRRWAGPPPTARERSTTRCTNGRDDVGRRVRAFGRSARRSAG